MTNEYIVCIVSRWTGCARAHRNRRSHHTASAKVHKKWDKPSAQLEIIFLYRTARFALCFTRGGFGVFRHAHSISVLLSAVVPGCRSPPFSFRSG